MAYHYLDSSAAVKLLVQEAESAELRAWVEQHPDLATSSLAWTEIHRALRRAGESIGALPSLMDSLLVLSTDVSLLRQAGSLEPPALRSLDAIHLASALRLASQLTGLVTYDSRLAAAAAAQGIRVVAPGSQSEPPTPTPAPPSNAADT